MRTPITFYGGAVDPQTGLPTTYHVYDVWERPAPWSGDDAVIATAYQLTANAPLPCSHISVVYAAIEGTATANVRAALIADPRLSGLTCV